MQKRFVQNFDFESGKDWIGRFLKFDTSEFSRSMREMPAENWERVGQLRALRLFHSAAKRVPAYKHFLHKHRVNPTKIRTVSDFESVPLTDKANYVNQYGIEERSWDGQVSDSRLVAISSGVSGEPKFWPRGEYQEYEASIIHELIYDEILDASKQKTLIVIGFPMGVYVSGVATLLPTWLYSLKKGATVVSAGNNKAEVLRSVKNLQGKFDQIILVGHPFFIKDVIETGVSEGVDWGKKRLKAMFCSEGFNEQWRDYLKAQVGRGASSYNFINTYGSSEFLLMGWETLFSILVRERLMEDPQMRLDLIGNRQVPNLFQYNPLLRYIEEVGGELACTSYSGVPMVRFNMHDSGTVLPFTKIQESMSKNNLNMEEAWKLPFVGLWGRSDYTIVFYAANIYPEHIQGALNKPKLFSRLTGKFVMSKDYLKNMDQYLEINIELRPGIRSSKRLESEMQKSVVAELEAVNMEYAFLRKNLDKDLVPRIRLWPYQHEKYFKPGLKPRYIRQN